MELAIDKMVPSHFIGTCPSVEPRLIPSFVLFPHRDLAPNHPLDFLRVPYHLNFGGPTLEVMERTYKLLTQRPEAERKYNQVTGPFLSKK